MTILSEMKICTIASSFTRASQKGCIGWSEGGALREGDKKVIDKTRPPVFNAKPFTLAFFDLHFAEKRNCGYRIPDACRARSDRRRRAANTERKDENIGKPKFRTRT